MSDASDKELLQAHVSEVTLLPVEQAATHRVQQCATVLLIGGSGAGKSELLACLKRAGVGRQGAAEAASRGGQGTMGVDFWSCIWERRRRGVKLVLFDSSGKDVFESVACSYMRRVMTCVVACDLKSETGLMMARMWAEKVVKQRGAGTHLVLVGTKDDAHGAAPRHVDFETLEQLGREVGAAHVCELSAFDGRGVLELFAWIVDHRPAGPQKQQQKKTKAKRRDAFTLTDEEDGLESDCGAETEEEEAAAHGCRCFCKYRKPARCCAVL